MDAISVISNNRAHIVYLKIYAVNILKNNCCFFDFDIDVVSVLYWKTLKIENSFAGGVNERGQEPSNPLVFHQPNQDNRKVPF